MARTTDREVATSCGVNLSVTALKRAYGTVRFFQTVIVLTHRMLALHVHHVRKLDEYGKYITLLINALYTTQTKYVRRHHESWDDDCMLPKHIYFHIPSLKCVYPPDLNVSMAPVTYLFGVFWSQVLLCSFFEPL
jgi:hypothetical protein